MNSNNLIKKQELYFYILTIIYTIINIYYLVISDSLITKIILFILACFTIFKLKLQNIDYIERYYKKFSDKKQFSIITFVVTSLIFILKILLVKLITLI